MADGGNSGGFVSVTRSHCHHCQCSPDHCTTTPSRSMGKYSGDNGYDIGCDTILPADMDDMASEACGKFEHTYDVDPDSW